MTGIPFGLSQVIMRCLEKDPASRFQDVADLAAALATYASPELSNIAVRLETVLEGQTLTHEVQLARAQLVADTTPESAPERTTEKMNRGAADRARMLVEALVRSIGTAAGNLFARLGAVRVRFFVSDLRRDRRSILMLGITAFLLALTAMILIVTLNERSKRSSPQPTPTTIGTSR